MRRIVAGLLGFLLLGPTAGAAQDPLYQHTGKRQEEQGHLTTATTMYREMGMTYWLEKAEGEVKELG